MAAACVGKVSCCCGASRVLSLLSVLAGNASGGAMYLHEPQLYEKLG